LPFHCFIVIFRANSQPVTLNGWHTASSSNHYHLFHYHHYHRLGFYLWNLLHVDFSHHETDFISGTRCILSFIFGTCFAPIFVREACCMLYFSSLSYFELSSLSYHGTCCVLIFILWICCVVIMLMEIVVCWILFIKRFACWFASSYIDFPIDFVHGICQVLLLFMKLTTRWFLFMCDFSLVWLKLVHWFFSSWNWFCSWNLLRYDFFTWNLLYAALFLKLVACWFFFSWKLYIDCYPRENDFVYVACCVLIICSWNFLHVDFSHSESFKFIFLLIKLILFIKLVAYWIFVRGTWCLLILFLWNLLHIDFSLVETCT